MSLRQRVRVKGTDIEGIVTGIGSNGMVRVNPDVLKSAFQRTVYHNTELEVIK